MVEQKTLFQVPFFTPKPEALLQRILHIATISGDWVLDSFAGSGTTGAVAHKMGRRWIMPVSAPDGLPTLARGSICAASSKGAGPQPDGHARSSRPSSQPRCRSGRHNGGREAAMSCDLSGNAVEVGLGTSCARMPVVVRRVWRRPKTNRPVCIPSVYQATGRPTRRRGEGREVRCRVVCE